MQMQNSSYPQLCYLLTIAKYNEGCRYPYCNHCQGIYETAAHSVGECDQYAALRWDIWGKLYLHPDDFQHVIVQDLVSFIGKQEFVRPR